MKRVITMVLVLMMIVLLYSSWSKSQPKLEEVEANRQLAIKFLVDKEYKIVSNNGEMIEYVLKKEDLLNLPYKQQWGLQKVDPENYIGKKIEVYKMIVKNHLLDGMMGNNKQQTIVFVMVVDHQVIGGYSIPDYDLPHYGGVYSLEGKTLEEVTGLSYQAWQAKWVEKYR